MTVCVFAGHREVYQPMIDTKIAETMDRLLETDTEFVFLTGGMGEFDEMGASAVRSAKRRYPHLKITLVLVLPYMSNRLNTEKKYYEYNYDEIIVPSELHNVHYKAAIQKRNRWMVDQANYVIAYIHRDFGGAFKTVKYAQKKGKPL